jgi:hypothetical protein
MGISFRHRARERPGERQAREDDQDGEGDGPQAATAEARPDEGVFAAMEGLGAVVPVVITAHPVSTNRTPSRHLASAMRGDLLDGRRAPPSRAAFVAWVVRPAPCALARGAQVLSRSAGAAFCFFQHGGHHQAMPCAELGRVTRQPLWMTV